MRWETGEPTVSERKLPRARRHPPVTPSSRFLIDEHRDIQGDLKFGICPLLFFIILSGNIYVFMEDAKMCRMYVIRKNIENS